MDAERSEISKHITEHDEEFQKAVFVRQVDDRALPAPQVLAEQQGGSSGGISGPLFIP